MRAVLFVTLLVGCSDGAAGSDPLSGELVYAEAPSGDLRRMNVETGEDHAIARGIGNGLLAASPDGQFIVRYGLGEPLTVIAMAGSITELQPQGQCAERRSPRWSSRHSLVYDACDSRGLVFYADVEMPPRSLRTGYLVQPSDGAWVAYVDDQDELVVESADGSDRRALGRFVAGDVAALSPDESVVIVTHEGMISAVQIADGAAVDLGGGWVPRYAAALDTRLLFSPDGTEILVARDGGLDAATIASGARRPVADGVPEEWYVASAAFVDATHVAYQRRRIDPDVIDSANQHFAVHLPTASFEGEPNRPCQIDVVDRDSGRVYVSCEGGRLLNATGDTIVMHPTLTAVGFVESGDVIGYSATGELLILHGDGTTTLLPPAAYAHGVDYVGREPT